MTEQEHQTLENPHITVSNCDLTLPLAKRVGADIPFTNRYLQSQLNGEFLFDGSTPVVRLAVEYNQGVSEFANGLSGGEFRIWLERNDDGLWNRDNREPLIGSVYSIYRDDRNRRCELNISVEPWLGTIPDEQYLQLLEHLFRIVPEGTFVKNLLGDNLTLKELNAALPRDYRHLPLKPREFYASEEQVSQILAKTGPLSDDDRVALETNLSDAALLSFHSDRREMNGYRERFIQGMSHPSYRNDAASLFTVRTNELFNHLYIQLLLPGTVWCRLAYQAGFKAFQYRSAEHNHGETDRKPNLDASGKPRQNYFQGCISCQKTERILEEPKPMRRGAASKSILSKNTSTKLPAAFDLNLSPARALLAYLLEFRNLSEEDLTSTCRGSHRSFKALAHFEGRDFTKKEPQFKLPEDYLSIRSHNGAIDKVDPIAFGQMVDEMKKQSHLRLPLARGDYTPHQLELMDRIHPTSSDFAIVLTHVKSADGMIDEKRDCTSTLAACERLQELGFYTILGSPLSFDPIESYGLNSFQRTEVAHLLDIVYGRERVISSKRAAIVCSFDSGSEIGAHAVHRFPKVAEFQRFGVSSVTIYIEGIFRDDKPFLYAQESQLKEADVINETYTEANERGLNDIMAQSWELTGYLKELARGGISVTLKGLGDPRNEKLFMDLSQFEETIDAGRSKGDTLLSRWIEGWRSAAELDEVVYPSQISACLSVHTLNITAGKLDALRDRAAQNRDSFTLSVLKKMQVTPHFLRKVALERQRRNEREIQ